MTEADPALPGIVLISLNAKLIAERDYLKRSTLAHEFGHAVFDGPSMLRQAGQPAFAMVTPNEGHLLLAKLESEYHIHIVTQNVDNLHEKAGSTSILHLHGELFKVRSTQNPDYILEWKHDLNVGDCDENGYQLRPHIVWFGEDVPAIEEAIEHCEQADYLAVIGTSLQVYPAAGLLRYTFKETPIFYIDPKPAVLHSLGNPLTVISKKASEGVDDLQTLLLS